MKKKLLISAFLLVTAVCLGLALGAGVTSGTYVSAAEYGAPALNAEERYYDNVNHSIDLYAGAMNPFSVSKRSFGVDDEPVYQDNFGGVYLDENGILNIGVVGLQNTTNGYDGQVLYRPQDFSYNELLKIQEALASVVAECGIDSVGIDERQNRVDVSLAAEEAADGVVEYLKAKGMYHEKALNLIVSPDSRIVPTAKTAYGGDRLNTSNFLGVKTYIGTMCANAFDRETGQYGILTNKHVADNGTMHVDGWLGTEIGTVTKSQWSGTIDAAFVPFTDQSNWSTTAHARYGSTTYHNIKLGDENLIIQGAPVKKIGQTTGITTGVITGRSETIILRDDADRVVLTRTIRISNESLPGDSGGPVYFDGGGQHLFLIGMTFGGPEKDETDVFGYACRITEVMRAFDVVPVLNGTMYDTTDLPDNEIRINSLNINFPASPDGSSVSFDVPSTINGRTVTEIGDYAFAGQSNIDYFFVLSDHIRTLGDYAFAHNPELKTVRWYGQGLTAIGANTFFDCPQLTECTLPNTVTSIGYSAFRDCVSLQAVLLPSSLTTIGSYAFGGCSSLTNLTIPDSVTTIGQLAFQNCNSLSVTLHYNPLLDSTLYLRQYLTAVHFSDGLSEIPEDAFQGCTRLSRIDIPDSVTRIGDYAFQNCFSLNGVTVPDSVTVIGKYAFHNSGLQNITIGASVATIGTADCAKTA